MYVESHVPIKSVKQNMNMVSCSADRRTALLLRQGADREGVPGGMTLLQCRSMRYYEWGGLGPTLTFGFFSSGRSSFHMQ